MRVAVIVLVLAAAPPVHAAEMAAAWATWVRAGPGAGAAIVEELVAGQRVESLGCAAGWCRIAPASRPGFVREAMLATLPRPALVRAPGECLDAIHATPAGPIGLRICPAVSTAR